MHYLRLIAVFFRTSVQTDMEYRADFFSRIFTSLLDLAMTIGGLSIAYNYTESIKGWTFPQTLVLVSVYFIMDGLIETLIAPNMRAVTGQVREGTLDFTLLKPVSAQFMSSFRTINIWRLGRSLVGLGLAIYALTCLSLKVGFVEAGAFAVTLVAGMTIVYSFWLALVTLTFWFVRISNIDQIIWQAYAAGRFPIEIYPPWLRLTLTYAIPVAFILTVPAQILTGQVGLHAMLISLAVAAVMLFLASAFWRFGLRHYTGASA